MCSKCDYWYALNYVLYPLVRLFLKLFFLAQQTSLARVVRQRICFIHSCFNSLVINEFNISLLKSITCKI